MPSPIRSRKIPEGVKRRLEVATATAWEGLVEVHSAHALRFIALLSDRLPFDEAVDRYLHEADIGDPMASSVRTRVLVALEDAERETDGRPSLRLTRGQDDDPHQPRGWKRFRPDVIMQGVKERQREHQETERWVQLAIARAEEAVINSHVDNAVTFTALLQSHLSPDDAVAEYVEALNILGGRAQAVHQRAMARLAEIHLPEG